MHPNKAKSLLAATVPAVAKLGHRRRGKRGIRSEERRNARRAHASKQREVEAWWECRAQHVGRTKARTLVKNTWNRAKGGGHLFGKSDGGSGRRGSPPERNTRPPGGGLGWRSSRSARSAFAQQRSTALTVLGTSTPCAAKGCDVIGLHETKRDETFEIVASGYRVFFSGDCSGV